MAYINTETLAYPVSEQDIRNQYPNTSFQTPFQPPEGYAPVLESPVPGYNAMTHGVREITPAEDSLGNWVRQYEVFDLTPEQVAANEQAARQSNKQQAETLLQQTDWTQQPDVDNPDNPPWLANKADFTAYRGQLRAIAVNPPVTVDQWPVKPDEVWEGVIPVMENLAADEVV